MGERPRQSCGRRRGGSDVVLAALNELIAEYEAEAERMTNPPVSGGLASTASAPCMGAEHVFDDVVTDPALLKVSLEEHRDALG